MSRPLTRCLSAFKNRCCIAALLAVCGGCTTPDKPALERDDDLIVLLNPESELGGDWEHRRLRRGNTGYDRIENRLGWSIRATGNHSASILFRLFESLDLDCGRMRWSWHVSKPQPGSDLRVKGRDDVAASVFVLFGDPGMFRDIPVPTIKYAWANDRHFPGEVIAGPYHEAFVRTLVVRTGSTDSRKLVTEQTDPGEDYQRLFGEKPKQGIHGVAIFTDNDDTGEPIVAYYGRIELLCRN